MGDTSELIRVYDWEGTASDVPACPTAESDWIVAPAESSSREFVGDGSDYQAILSDTEGLLHLRVVRWRVLAIRVKLILQVELEDGSTVVARKLMDKEHLKRLCFIKDDESDIHSLREMMHSEARVLRWLETSTTLPVPRILYPLGGIEEEGDFVLQAMLPGEVILNGWSKLSTAGKNRVVEQFARASVQMFRLDVPQKIGSILANGNITSEPHNVRPPYHVSFSAPHTFDNISEYIDYLIEARKNVATTLGLGHNGHVDELKGHMMTVLSEIEAKNQDMSSLLRCVFVHADLDNPQNVLVSSEGGLTGIIDWEFHLIHPAILAAEYPAWLLYDGTAHPESVKKDMYIWLDSPEESKRLRALYRQIVKGLDAEYHDALVQGEKLRACVSWLLTNAESDNDIGCARLKIWMDCVFK